MSSARRPPSTIAVFAVLLLSASTPLDVHPQPDLANPVAPEMVLQFGHAGNIQKLIVSDDGRRLLSIGDDFTVRVWDVPSGELLRTMPEDSGESFLAAYFKDADRPVIVGDVIGPTRRDIRIRDVASGQVILSWLAPLREQSKFVSVAVSADGETIALRAGRYGAPIALFSTRTGAALGFLDAENARGRSCLALSRDGNLLAHARNSYDSQRVTEVWQVKTRRKLFEVPDTVGTKCPAAFTPDGRLLIIAGLDGAVRLWDAQTGELRRILPTTSVPRRAPDGLTYPYLCSDPCVSALAISADGRWLVVGKENHIVSLWDITTGKEIRRVEDAQGQIWAVAISPEGKWVAYGGTDYDIRIFDAQTGHSRVLSTNPALVQAIACSTQANSCASAMRDKVVRLWNLTSGRETTLSGHGSQVNAVSFSADGRWLVSGSGDKAVRIFDVASGAEIREMPGHARAVTSVAFSPDSRWVASGSVGGEVKVWERESGALLHPLMGTARLEKNDSAGVRRVLAVHFNLNGRELTVSYADGEVTVFDIATARVRHSFGVNLTDNRYGVPTQDSPLAMSWRPDDQWIAATYTGGTVAVWNAQDGSLVRRLSHGVAWVQSAAFSPDGRWLATASGATINIWDTRTWSASTLRGHQGLVKSVAFGPDPRRLISGSGDGTVRIWDLASKRAMAVVVSQKEGRQSVVVSPTGLFDGSAESMQMVAWRVPNTLDVMPLDAFFTDFFRPGLFADLMEGADPAPPVEFAAVVQVPGLRTMLAQKQAHMETRNGRPVVCFSEPPQVATEMPVTERQLRPRVTHGFRIDPNDRTCPYQRELPITGPNAAAIVDRLSKWKLDRVSTPWDGKRSTDTSASTLHVFVTGVGDYPSDSGFDRLPYASSSARAIESFFREKSRTRSPYATVRVWDGLYDGRATRTAIRQRLAEMASTIKDYDVVLLYFAGHGVVPSGQQMFYFVPIDGRNTDLRRTGVSTVMLADGIRSVAARRVVLFIDACQSGGAVEPLTQIAAVKAKVELRRARVEPQASGQKGGVGVHVIAATLPLSYAVQITQEQSALTATTLAALRQGQEITIGQVSSYLSQHLPEASGRVAAGFRQVPFIDSLGLDFPIAWR